MFSIVESTEWSNFRQSLRNVFVYGNRSKIETVRNNENNEKIDRDTHFLEFHALNATTSREEEND